MSLAQAIDFIREVDKLKSIHRKTYNYHEPRHENSAEHSWHIALAVLVFEEFSEGKKLDVLKAIKMALIHDIVEIDAGDNIVYAKDPDKYDREKRASERLFGLLPENLSLEFQQLWEEFELKQSPEAQFVGGLDRFLPLLSNIINDGYTWKKFGIQKQDVINLNKKPLLSSSSELWSAAESMINEYFDKKQ